MPNATRVTAIPSDRFISVTFDDGTSGQVTIEGQYWPDLDAIAGVPVHAVQWRREDSSSAIEAADWGHHPIDDAVGDKPLVVTILETFGAALVRQSMPRPVTNTDIAAEAETRIARGILVDGEPFQADGESRQRLGEMIRQFHADKIGPEGVTFMTGAGREITWTRVDQPEAVADAVGAYVVAVLKQSAVLRRGELPSDPTDDRHWPARPNVLLPI